MRTRQVQRDTVYSLYTSPEMPLPIIGTLNATPGVRRHMDDHDHGSGCPQQALWSTCNGCRIDEPAAHKSNCVRIYEIKET